MSTPHDTAALERGAPGPEPARLTWPAFGVCLAILLAIFLFLNPIWRSDAIGEWDENIWWSYYPIPVLVAVALALERKLGWGPFWLETMKLTFVKFTVTFLLANGLWAYWGAPGTGQPEREGPLAADSDEFELRPAPPATPLDPATLGRLEGRVLDAAGAPVADALVHVSAGLDALRFAPPEAPALLLNAGEGFRPPLVVVQSFQELRLSSQDDALHTAVFARADDGHRLLNVPVLAGAERALLLPRGYGLLEVTCSVHGKDEPRALVLALGHPFVTRTDADGRFALEGVPGGALELRALAGERHGPPCAVELAPGGAAELTLNLD